MGPPPNLGHRDLNFHSPGWSFIWGIAAGAMPYAARCHVLDHT